MPDRCDREGEKPLAPEVQTNEGHKGRVGTVSAKSSGELSDQKRLSILSWNAGPKRRKVANGAVGAVGSFHVIPVQEAESHFHEIVASTEQQFHVQQVAHPVSQKHLSA